MQRQITGLTRVSILTVIFLTLCGFQIHKMHMAVIARRADKWGPATSFSSQPGGIRGRAADGNDRIVLGYFDEDDGYAGDVIIANVDTSPRNLSISFGNSYEFDGDIFPTGGADRAYPLGVTFFDSDAYVAGCFTDDGAGDDGFVEMRAVTGVAITAASSDSDEYDTSSSREQDIVEIADNKLLIVYEDGNTAIDGAVYTMNGSGGIASSSTEQNESGNNTSCIKIDKVATDKGIVAYRNESSNSRTAIVCASVSGNTITWGTVVYPQDSLGVDLTAGWRCSIVTLKDNHFVAATTSKNYPHSSQGQYRVWAIAGKVTGDTTVTLGTAFAVSDEDGQAITVGKVDEDNAILVWRTNDASYPNTNTLAYKTMTVDWDNLTFKNYECPLMPTTTANVIDSSLAFDDIDMIPIINVGDNRVVVIGRATIDNVGRAYVGKVNPYN